LEHVKHVAEHFKNGERHSFFTRYGADGS
jgi:hypothetical protein